MDANELAIELETTSAIVRGWVKEGLPTEKKRPLVLNREQAISWLLDQGKIEPIEVERICLTKDEIAREMDVSSRTIGTWLKDPSFPGRAGNPGRRDGYFPLEAIQEWRRINGPDYEDSEINRKIKWERYLLLKQRNDRESSQYVGPNEVTEVIAEALELMKPILAKFEEELLSAVLPHMRKKQHNQVRRIIQNRIDHATRPLKKGFVPPDAEEETM